MPNPTPVHLEPPPWPPFWRSTAGAVALGFLTVGVLFLFTEHRGHVLGILPFVFVLACPLLHVFTHRGHGHAHSVDKQSPHRENQR